MYVSKHCKTQRSEDEQRTQGALSGQGPGVAMTATLQAAWHAPAWHRGRCAGLSRGGLSGSLSSGALWTRQLACGWLHLVTQVVSARMWAFGASCALQAYFPSAWG